MPFTLSHAAAVLPAVRIDGTGRGPLVPSLLVAGSFAPDLTYYAASVVPGAMEFGDFTHSFTGVFTFDVLVTWALVGVWLVLREPLVALLPRRRQGRVAALVGCGAGRQRLRRRLRLSEVLWWYVSAALGALTHVVWDAFTHLDRWGMRMFPVGACAVHGGPVGGRGRDRGVRARGRGAAGGPIVGVLGFDRQAVRGDPHAVLRGRSGARARAGAVRGRGQGVASCSRVFGGGRRGTRSSLTPGMFLPTPGCCADSVLFSRPPG